MILLQWTLFYLLPAVIAVGIKNNFRDVRVRISIMHAGMIVSIALLSSVGLRLVWHVSAVDSVVLICSVALALFTLRTTGILYAISSFAQEWCILLAGSYLTLGYGIVLGAIATALVYTFAHRVVVEHRSWKYPLLISWGIASVLLYQWLHQPLLNIAIHTAIGAMLIHKKLLYGDY